MAPARDGASRILASTLAVDLQNEVFPAVVNDRHVVLERLAGVDHLHVDLTAVVVRIRVLVRRTITASRQV